MEDQDTCNSSITTGGGARYKLMSPAKLPISRSTCITIPPGLSPTSFLESPVLLTNVKAEPSPTTGSFLKLQTQQGSSRSAALSLNANYSGVKSLDDSNSSFFEFKPHISVSGLEVSAGFNLQSEKVEKRSEYQPTPSCGSCENTAQKEQPTHMMVHAETNKHASESGHNNHSGPGPGPAASERPSSSDDGYNWRKYGQKVVKGSEFPRSYYKCTHPNCEVKKIFERSYTGKITEIVYKGTHDHPKPQPTRRVNPGALTSIQEDNNADKVASVTAQTGGNYSQTPNSENGGTPVPSPIDNDDLVDPQLNTTTNDEVDDDEDPYSKRRRMDYGSLDVTPVVKPVREPRVVVQTISEVDILDDGYRWRKYGQKVVRGNPNPRSYYKCTSVGCQVRKHVERASHDPKAVITTYEGKHNHDVPSARNGTHDAVLRSSTRAEEDGGIGISLDLVVGNNVCEQQRLLNSADYKWACYGGVYRARENEVEAEPPNNYDVSTLNHSSNPYPQNLGRILLGP